VGKVNQSSKTSKPEIKISFRLRQVLHRRRSTRRTCDLTESNESGTTSGAPAIDGGRLVGTYIDAILYSRDTCVLTAFGLLPDNEETISEHHTTLPK
jgi:hypothetical protein